MTDSLLLSSYIITTADEYKRSRIMAGHFISFYSFFFFENVLSAFFSFLAESHFWWRYTQLTQTKSTSVLWSMHSVGYWHMFFICSVKCTEIKGLFIFSGVLLHHTLQYRDMLCAEYSPLVRLYHRRQRSKAKCNLKTVAMAISVVVNRSSPFGKRIAWS